MCFSRSARCRHKERAHISDSKHAGNYAPKTFAASPNADRYSKKDFAGAMERLFDAGEIRMEVYGRPSDQRRHIVRVVNEARDEP
jgi:hypothetical protein